MHDFHFEKGQLWCEGLRVEALAKKYGTPLFVYSQRTVARHFQRLDQALASLDHWICFSVKSNGNIALLRLLSSLGSGFDIVSQGELGRVRAAGGALEKCIFAGVGKSEGEIEEALRSRIYSINLESEPELARIDAVARRLKVKAPVAVRVNPNVDAQTHAKITTGTYQNKFGIPMEEVEALYARASRRKHVQLRGIQMHIGSQLTSVKPFEQAVGKIAPLVRTLSARYPSIEFFSIGGGLGIVYDPTLESSSEGWWKSARARDLLTPEKYAAALLPHLKPLRLRILLEPGRFISGNAGILVTRIEYVKKTGRKNFVIVDAAMNDLIRPSFYDAYHEITPLRSKKHPCLPSDVVGPICESGDYFCKDRPLPKMEQGDYVALMSAGAYGFVMASNYNGRPLAAEVLVNGRRAAIVRERQPLDDLWRLERIPEWLCHPSKSAL